MRKILPLPPPPLNRVGFWRSRKKRLEKFNNLNLAALHSREVTLLIHQFECLCRLLSLKVGLIKLPTLQETLPFYRNIRSRIVQAQNDAYSCVWTIDRDMYSRSICVQVIIILITFWYDISLRMFWRAPSG